MYKLASFLDKYDTIIFDLDGVITREQQYWNAAALTVWEFLYSKNYFGKEHLDAPKLMKNYTDIRNKVFADDKLITLFKSKGVNSNWDLGYIIFATVMLNDGNFDKAFLASQNYSDNILDDYPIIAHKLTAKLGIDCERNSELWLSMQSCFQEWFLGDTLFTKKYNKNPILSGKSGLCYEEEPIIDGEKLITIMKMLHEKGVRLCVASGRPLEEAMTAIEKFKILEYLDPNAIICYNFVEIAEAELGINLTKPHPFMFTKAMLGASFPNKKLLEGDFPKEQLKRTLGVGDAGADILSAHNSGMDFCAVLTGISGKAAKGYFEQEKAEFILDSLEDFLG